MTIETSDFQRLGLSEPMPDVLKVVQAMYSAAPMNALGVETSRENARRRNTAPAWEDVRSVSDVEISAGGGRFRIRLYRPTETDRQPVVVYFHAGGWILGDLEHSDHLCRRMANRTGAVVANVDYRLVPEVRFPSPLEDCLNAVSWVREHALAVGGDPGRIALAGESSGGNLAAAVAMELCRTEAAAGLRFLLLMEPALDIRQDTGSWARLGDILAPKREQMAWMWSLYAPTADMRSDPRVSPSLAKDVPAGHPRTLIVAAEYDPLRDEAMAYADKLAAAGVPVSARIEPGLTHAFCNMGGVLPLGLEKFDVAVSEMNASLQEAD